jgi:hypothetical protein
MVETCAYRLHKAYGYASYAFICMPYAFSMGWVATAHTHGRDIMNLIGLFQGKIY